MRGDLAEALTPHPRGRPRRGPHAPARDRGLRARPAPRHRDARVAPGARRGRRPRARPVRPSRASRVVAQGRLAGDPAQERRRRRALPAQDDRRRSRAAIAEMGDARSPDAELVGFTVNEFVPHDPSLGGQLLLGMRWTEEFGPVVTFGPGGVHAEFLARNLRPGRDTAILSPRLAGAARIDAALEAAAITPAATGRLRGQASRVTAGRPARPAAALPRPGRRRRARGRRRVRDQPARLDGRTGPVALDALVRLGDAGRRAARRRARWRKLGAAAGAPLASPSSASRAT